MSAPAQPNRGGNNGSNGNVPPNGQLLTLEEDEEERYKVLVFVNHRKGSQIQVFRPDEIELMELR